MFGLIKTALATSHTITASVVPASTLANIFQWAIGIGALLALGVITFGGVKYAASAGRGSIQEDAKEWIKAAIWGLALLIGAYIILNTINPNILRF